MARGVSGGSGVWDYDLSKIHIPLTNDQHVGDCFLAHPSSCLAIEIHSLKKANRVSSIKIPGLRGESHFFPPLKSLEIHEKTLE